ncbi:MAG: fibronectin type III domain-containing protein, partial [Granulosicoccus sp.]|nr:fibronectin type III domain-containing protein [Granulosicoccus sp.]
MRNFAANQRLGAVCVLAGTVSFSPGAAANEAPTAPGNFTAIAVSSTEIRLSWDPSVDDKRVRFYELVRDEAVISRTGKLTYTDNNLSAGVTYLYTVVASDGQLVSPVASYSISTPLADPDETDNSPGKSGKNGKGGKNDPAPEEPPTEDPPAEEPPVEEPPAEEPPTEDPPVEEPPAEEPPTEEPPAGGAPQGWQVTFNDDFSGSGDLDISSAGRNWRFETMSDGLHRAGNT